MKRMNALLLSLLALTGISSVAQVNFNQKKISDIFDFDLKKQENKSIVKEFEYEDVSTAEYFCLDKENTLWIARTSNDTTTLSYLRKGGEKISFPIKTWKGETVTGIKYDSNVFIGHDLLISTNDSLHLISSMSYTGKDFSDIKNSSVIGIDNKNNFYITGENNSFYLLNSKSDKLEEKSDWFEDKVINIVADSNNTIYFTVANYGLYILKDGQETPDPIDGEIKNVSNIILGADDKVYAASGSKIYVLKDGNNIETKQLEIDESLIRYESCFSIDDNNTLYFARNAKDIYENYGLYILEEAETKPKLFKTGSANVNAIISYNNTLYFASKYKNIGVDKEKITQINFSSQNLLNYNDPNYQDVQSNKFVYKEEQTINIYDENIKVAQLDKENLIIPGNIPLISGEHELKLFLKDEYSEYAIFFDGGYNFGWITYNFWIKTNINDVDVNFEVNQNTELLTDLISNSGNTKNIQVIQTKNEIGDANLMLDINDSLIDYNINNTYLIQGDINDNDFSSTGEKQSLSNDPIMISNGIYELCIVDKVGNLYKRYLEIGAENWKIKGSILGPELKELSEAFNVNYENVTKELLGKYTDWFVHYQEFATLNIENIAEEVIDISSKGFANSEDKEQIKDFFVNQNPPKNYLKEITWTEDTSTDYMSFFNLEGFKNIIDGIINQIFPEKFETAYQNALFEALENLELHGYSIEELMDGRITPQTKDEINNFKDGISWHDWLQDQANSKYQSWQLSMGLGISIPLAVLLAIVSFGLWKYNRKYNPAGARRKLKIKKNKEVNLNKIEDFTVIEESTE